MLRAIREISPRWVVGENVLGLVNWSDGLVFDEVQTDLETAGYEVQPYVLPAAAVNAPHRRDRIWFVAYSTGRRAGSDIGGVRGVFNGYNQRKEDESFIADTNFNRYTSCRESEGIKGNWSGNDDEQKEWSESTKRINGLDGFQRDVADTVGIRRGQDERLGHGESNVINEIGKKWNAADTDVIRQRGQSDGIGKSKFNGKNCKRDDWANFPTQSPICSRNDGISERLDSITFPKWRNESIKAAGNAIVPQVVYQIFKAIEQYEQLNTTTT